MAKSKKLEELLASLTEVRNEPTSEAGIAILQQILNSKFSIAIAQAAKVIGDAEVRSLIPELAAAFSKFMMNGAETDPSCKAKQRIAEALYRLDYSEESLFLEGIHFVQKEPNWGGSTDTAAALRGTCALGLVRMNYRDVMSELADLLADAESEARIGAVRAIAYTANPQAVPLLRYKARIGDIDPQVISECFTGLLSLAPQASLSLIASFLDKSPEIGEMAALALGESRQPEAFEILRRWWQRTVTSELRLTGLLAIAMLRQDEALEFLLTLVATGNKRDREGAIGALKMYQSDAILWQRVQQAMAGGAPNR
ncbi:MAG: HEAT repeat domain-containing protein [Cyanobacteria bacterium CAN_BIN43]|nr:HEAT repeat domain-containing protein [Cyanobacteria bacterium CAN_BIN43]